MNVPAPLKGAVAVSASVEPPPCVKLPVNVILAVVTVAEFALVTVLPADATMAPPKVIFTAPSSDWVAANVAVPEPLSKVVPLFVIPPLKFVLGSKAARFHTPPGLIVTMPTKAFVPPPDVTLLTRPVMDDVPCTVNPKPARFSVAPVSTVKVPVMLLVAPLIIVDVPERFTLPVTVVMTVADDVEPLILKLPLMVVTPVMPLPLVPLKPRLR